MKGGKETARGFTECDIVTYLDKRREGDESSTYIVMNADKAGQGGLSISINSSRLIITTS